MQDALIAAAERRAIRDARHDLRFRGLVATAGGFVLLALGGAALSMLWGGWETFSTFGLDFVTSSNWDAIDQQFGVPLDPDQEAAVRVFDRLDRAVVGPCHGLEVLAESGDCLVVEGVDFGDSRSERVGEPGAGLDLDPVTGHLPGQ